MQHKDRTLREDAFYTDLYQRHAPALFAYVYRRTASREDAEDIVLDVFLMVLRQEDFAKFDEQKQAAWLWTITHHKVVDRFRKSARQPHIPIDPLADTLYEDDELSPEREHLKREEYTQLHRAIKALPEEQREVLHLRFGSGLRCAEIAPVLDKSEGAIRMLLYRTIRTLRHVYAAAGERYTVQSYVSSADRTELRGIPLPAAAPQLPQNYNGQLPSTYYHPAILRAYLQLPKNLDPRILAKAKQVTAGAKSMYDKAEALESYLRETYTYDVNVALPPGQEAVSWFLFNGGNRGFCNYFATALAIMARELGMPARVVIGYTAGTFDAKRHEWMVHASDAHAWTQIYFAGYGWINFEPSSGFSQFPRPL